RGGGPHEDREEPPRREAAAGARGVAFDLEVELRRGYRGVDRLVERRARQGGAAGDPRRMDPDGDIEEVSGSVRRELLPDPDPLALGELRDRRAERPARAVDALDDRVADLAPLAALVAQDVELVALL